MEFEKTLYRVHERTLECLRHDQQTNRYFSPSLILYASQYAFLILGCVQLFLLYHFHTTFVGQEGCMGSFFPNKALRDDAVLMISLEHDANTTLYEFCSNPALLGMTNDFRVHHNISSINITLPMSCLDVELNIAAYLLETMIGYDTIVINQLMYTFRSDGLLKNLVTEEEWNWSKTSFQEPTTWAAKSWSKLVILLRSLIAFFFMSNTTALIVRTMISSGVVIVYPLLRFWNCQSVFAASYPWLGIPMQEIQRNNLSVVTFAGAHFVKTVIYYSLYEACQVAWTSWIYDKSVPAGMHIISYGILMMWEYFAMIYLRSSLSITVYPRVCFLLFMWFQIYFYSYLYGFFLIALSSTFMLVLSLMLFVIRVWEVPALNNGMVSLECPRQLYVSMGIPYWSALLSPSWTIFHPLNTRMRGVYEELIPPRILLNSERGLADVEIGISSGDHNRSQ